jgi:hypothetical protein
LPSQTTLAGIYGAIANLTGVTHVSFDNNTTSSTDGNGVPSHTLSMVVLGGNLQSIVNIIGARTSIGAGTYGNTSGVYVDPNYGFSYTIHFSIPSQLTVLVKITITPLTGYSSAVGAEIQNAVAAFINAIGIGQNVLLSRLYAPALLQGPFAAPASPLDPTTYEITALTIGVQATFTATISTTVMTVTAVASGVIQVGATIAGAGVTGGTTISSFGTGSGGVGTYNLSASMTVGSETITSILYGSSDLTINYDQIAISAPADVTIIT